MLLGIKLQAHPTANQKTILSQWMGCTRFIWNAKCEEERYYGTFAKKYCSIGTYAPIDQKYSQFKDKELCPWLYQVPSQILRNSAVNWYLTYKKFMQKECGRPRRKQKTDSGSVHLTKELFKFVKCDDGVTRLFIGTKSNNIGFLSIKNHCKYGAPNSIYIKKRHGNYWVSFCYDSVIEDSDLLDQKEHLEYLKTCDEAYLNKYTVGIDRGVVRPVQCGNKVYDFTLEQKRKKQRQQRYIKRYQRKLSRQQKGSKRRYRTKQKISKSHQKISNIRKDFCHKTSFAIVNSKEHKIIIFEDLKTKNMTKRPKTILAANGGWEHNNAKAKAGLNKSILDKGWHQLETFIKYKAYKQCKAWFKVSANHTSMECAACSHTHPNNRKQQSIFVCEDCGHSDNADRNAAEVIKQRAIKLFLDSGTELSKRGVLRLDTGRGAINKSQLAKASSARGLEASKKKRKAAA